MLSWGNSFLETLACSEASVEATTEQAGEPVSVLIAPERVNLTADEVVSLTAQAPAVEAATFWALRRSLPVRRAPLGLRKNKEL